MITKPSGITSYSSTLINNIFTNILERDLMRGLLINDITDHLPVFVIYNSPCGKDKCHNVKFKYRRIITGETINQFKTELSSLNWKTLYEENYQNRGFEIVISTFKNFYNKNFPVTKFKNRHNFMDLDH